MKQPDSIIRLISKFRELPGVGAKTAARYAFRVIDMNQSEVEDFCDALLDVKEKIRFCAVCGGLSDAEVCPICLQRDKTVICVVAQAKDIQSIERTGYAGVYHVLGGTLSPLDGRGPDDIRIKQLLCRLDGVTEVIMATNPDVEGEATAAYLSRLLKPLVIRVTRLAQGISMGSDIEYADEATLSHALVRRTEL
ncbi:MAG: recombination mediator RecR [Firmicutes bacterium]|nr:recombination mediator RecR [Bacillota bacterium]